MGQSLATVIPNHDASVIAGLGAICRGLEFPVWDFHQEYMFKILRSTKLLQVQFELCMHSVVIEIVKQPEENLAINPQWHNSNNEKKH